ncbi:MAG: NAD(P)H-hydrate dehydratase [Planctomycetaceae bacterium]|nr:MAG: NAD(P)H-hydrate dehydratase [Planctomycetaceae bacterium]
MLQLEIVTALPVLPVRQEDSHKGTFGHALIVGGSAGMIGAVALAANAALRGGAGLVTFAAPASVQQAVAVMCPCATSIPLACNKDGGLAARAVRQVRDAIAGVDVVALGPGLAVGTVQQNIVQATLEQDKPAVIDADGLNNLAALADWASLRKCPLVLTPHPGEFARLTGASVKEIQADRQNSAVAAVRRWQEQADPATGPLVLVLKGAGTIVTDGRRVYTNDTGNPGMATGGTGDVLTGLIAALIGQKFSPFDAACLAVHCHGRAGDMAAQCLGQMSMIATDLLDYLPDAINQMME